MGGKPLTLDLCKPHLKKFLRSIAPPLIGRPPKEKPLKRPHQSALLRQKLAALSPAARRERTAAARAAKVAKAKRREASRREHLKETAKKKKIMSTTRTPPAAQLARDDRLRDALLAILARNRSGWLARKDFGKLGVKATRLFRGLTMLREARAITMRGTKSTARYQITPKGVGRAHRKKEAPSTPARGRGTVRPTPRATPGRASGSTRAQGSNGAAREAGLPVPADTA